MGAVPRVVRSLGRTCRRRGLRVWNQPQLAPHSAPAFLRASVPNHGKQPGPERRPAVENRLSLQNLQEYAFQHPFGIVGSLAATVWVPSLTSLVGTIQFT